MNTYLVTWYIGGTSIYGSVVVRALTEVNARDLAEDSILDLNLDVIGKGGILMDCTKLDTTQTGVIGLHTFRKENH